MAFKQYHAVFCAFLCCWIGYATSTSVLLSQSHYAKASLHGMNEWYTSHEYHKSCPCTDPKLCDPVKQQYSKEVFAFSTQETNWKKYPFEWNVLTTIAITYATSTKFDPQMVCYAHAHSVRVVALVDFPKNQLTNDSARAAWVKQTLEMAQTLYLDGVNLDFEESISLLEVAEREALTALTLELYTAFKSWSTDTQISFDTPISPTCATYGRCFDYAGLAKFTDFLFLMAYDESGSRKPYANSIYDIAVQGVKQFLSLGISPKNLVLGLPWYGYIYRCSYIPEIGSCQIYSPLDGRQVSYTDIQTHFFNQSTTCGRLFDNPSLSPYLNFKDKESGFMQQIWYDDPESLTYKIVFARSESLRGVGMWTADTLDYSDSPEGFTEQNNMWGTFLRF